MDILQNTVQKRLLCFRQGYPRWEKGNGVSWKVKDQVTKKQTDSNKNLWDSLAQHYRPTVPASWKAKAAGKFKAQSEIKASLGKLMRSHTNKMLNKYKNIAQQQSTWLTLVKFLVKHTHTISCKTHTDTEKKSVWSIFLGELTILFSLILGRSYCVLRQTQLKLLS